jgi:hypothetical protein
MRNSKAKNLQIKLPTNRRTEGKYLKETFLYFPTASMYHCKIFGARNMCRPTERKFIICCNLGNL